MRDFRQDRISPQARNALQFVTPKCHWPGKIRAYILQIESAV
jgi:hypothetical protein